MSKFGRSRGMQYKQYEPLWGTATGEGTWAALTIGRSKSLLTSRASGEVTEKDQIWTVFQGQG